jgi:uncharacterized membrane protein YoaK (UPF0700 family)
MPLEHRKNRKQQSHLLLGASTAAAAAMVNVAGVMVFFAYTSNITGHVATLAQEIVKGHWYQTAIVFIWLMMFFGGSFVAQLLISRFEKTGSSTSHALPIILEILVLLYIGFYGHFYYHESLKETEVLIASLLFCMGLQNSMVAILSGNQVKTTHLTGLITDLGREVSLWLFEKHQTPKLMVKLKLHVTILLFYLMGGIFGGYLFLYYEFQVFYLVAIILISVLYFHLTRRRRNQAG